MRDGSTVLAMVKPGAKLTEADEAALAEYAEFCRARTAKKQRQRNAELLPGAQATEGGR